jgi:predicted transglutaminase-like cysteine proteinase
MSFALRSLRVFGLAVALTALAGPVTLVAAPFAASDQAGQPFAPTMLMPSGGGPLARWLGVWRDWSKEKHAIDTCRQDRSRCTNAAAIEFLAIVDNAKALDGRAQLGEINRAVNTMIKPVSDLAAHGSTDVWSTPFVTLAKRSGDCEDYAILKFAMLLEVGIAAENLRLLIVHDAVRSEDHAVVGVRSNGQWLMLDNRHLVLLADTQVARYTPMLLLQIGSAQRYSDALASAGADPAFVGRGTITQ